MYRVNDRIIYGTSGVCQVEAVGEPAGIPGAGGGRLYYTLRPLFDNGVIRVPVDAKVFMRPILTRSEAEALIARIPEIEEEDCAGGASPQLLSEHYRSFFTSHRCEDLLTLIKTVYAKSQRAGSRGKAMGRTDQHYFQRAKDLLEQEFSVSLGIPLAEVSEYIAGKVAGESPVLH